MSARERAPWQIRYKIAFKRCGIALALSAFFFPMLMIGFVYLLEKTGICVASSLRDLRSSCSILGYEFGDALGEVLLPTAFGIVTTGLLVMSGICTMIYLLWRIKEK